MKENVSPPTIAQVAEKLNQLVSGELSREQASNWASPWITKFDDFELEDRELDRKFRLALERIAGADTPTTDREYLFGRSDFEAWLQDLTE